MQGLPLRDRVEWAARTARTVMSHPSLYCATIDVEPAGGSCGVLHCGFCQERRHWLGLRLVDLCLVRIAECPDTVAVVSHGTFSARRYRCMAAVKEYPLPTRPLDLADLAVEPADVYARVRQGHRFQQDVSRERLGGPLRDAVIRNVPLYYPDHVVTDPDSPVCRRWSVTKPVYVNKRQAASKGALLPPVTR